MSKEKNSRQREDSFGHVADAGRELTNMSCVGSSCLLNHMQIYCFWTYYILLTYCYPVLLADACSRVHTTFCPHQSRTFCLTISVYDLEDNRTHLCHEDHLRGFECTPHQQSYMKNDSLCSIEIVPLDTVTGYYRLQIF